MAGGNFPEFKTGQKLQAFQASFLNSLVAMVNAAPSPTPGGTDTMNRPADTILALNSFGEDLMIGRAVALLMPMVTPAESEPQFTTNLIMEATDTSGEGEGSFGVAMQNIKADTVGRMCVSGMCPALVTLDVAEDYTRCDYDPTSQTLIAAETGSAQIIWEPGTDGEQWCVIRFGVSGQDILVKVTDGDSTPDYLDNQITTGAYLTTEVVGADGADQSLNFVHTVGGSDHTLVGPMIGEPTGGNGVTIVDVAPVADAYLQYQEYQDNADDVKHSLVEDKGTTKYIVFPNTTDILVKADAADTTSGYLSEKLTVTPVAGFSWLDLSLIPGGAANNQVLIEHGPWNSTTTTDVTGFVSTIAGGNGITTPGAAPADAPYVSYTEYTYEYDANNHSIMTVVAGTKYIAFPEPDGKVKVDAADTTAGYLDDEIEVDPGGGADFWLEKTVDPGGAADNKLLIEHATALQTAAYLEDLLRVEEEIVSAGGGVELITDGSNVPDGYAYVDLPGVMLRADDAGHFGIQEDITDLRHIEWLALPTDAATDDLIRWDGSKWVKEPTVVQTVVTATQWDSTAHEFQQKTRSIRVIAEAAESAWTTVTATTAGCP